MSKTIEIFSVNNCVYCENAKRDLNKRWREGISIVEYNITDNPSNKNMLLDRLKFVPKRLTAPQIFIDGNRIGGYNELLEYFEETSWKENEL